MSDGYDRGDSQLRLRDYVIDKEHPKGSPLIGRILSATVCQLGHDIGVMEYRHWDEDWLACATCGARFLPASAIDEDTEVIEI